MPQFNRYTNAVALGDVIEVTLSADTAIMADNDVIAATQEVTGFFRVSGGRAYLHSLILLDEDDQAQDIDIIFLNADGSVGNENAVFAPSDTVARTIIGAVSVTSSDYIDANTSQFAVKSNIGLLMEAASGSTSIFVAAVCRSGTPTYTASGLKLKLSVIWD